MQYKVYFEPTGYIEDSTISTPLNQAASESLKLGGMNPNVPYSIKESAGLKDTMVLGLKIYDEQQSIIKVA